MSSYLRKPCILLVEDHLAMRKIIKSVLLGLGINAVVEAPDGVEALNILNERNKFERTSSQKRFLVDDSAKRPIEFIICDWIMPRLTGIELLETIRRDAELKDLPFIMLTAENTREEIMRAVQLGITDYIVKPFRSAVLEAKLRSYLEIK